MSGKNDLKTQIELLILLQNMDGEAFDLQAEKDSFPGRIQEMDALLASKEEGAKVADENLKALQVAKNDKETEIGVKEEQIAKHEGQLYQIKNNNEYKALQGEIDSIKADISLMEEGILKLFDDIEAAQAKCQEEKNIFQEETKKIEQEKARINSEEKELDLRIADLHQRHKAATDGIDEDVLATYEKIRKNRGKAALAKITGNICGECHMHLRPQIISEATMRKRLVLCENCARILYIEEG